MTFRSYWFTVFFKSSISLLICHQLIIESGVLQSAGIIVKLSIFFQFSFCFRYFEFCCYVHICF